jgi:hypothetical protein
VYLTQGDKKQAIIPITWCCAAMKDIMGRRNGRKLVAKWKVCPYCGEAIIIPMKSTRGGSSSTKPHIQAGSRWIIETATQKRKVLRPGVPLPEGHEYLKKVNVEK